MQNNDERIKSALLKLAQNSTLPKERVNELLEQAQELQKQVSLMTPEDLEQLKKSIPENEFEKIKNQLI